MSKDLFDELVGTPPPSTVDVRAIVARRRHVIVARRLGAAMTSLVVLGVVALAGVTWLGGGGAGRDLAPATGFRLALDSQQSAAATGDRLSEALAQAVAAYAPGSHWSDGGPRVRKPDRETKPELALFGGGYLERDAKGGNVDLSIYTLTAVVEPLLNCTAPVTEDGMSCVASTAPNDGRMVVRTTPEQGAGGLRQGLYEVRVELPGRYVLELATDNSGQASTDTAQTVGPRQRETILTQGELVDIAMSVVGQIRS